MVKTPDDPHNDILDKLSAALVSAGNDLPALIENIVRTMADLVGDGCTITLLDVNGETMRGVACAHQDRNIERAYKVYMASLKVDKLASNTITAEVIREGTPKVGTIQPEQMVARTDSALKALVTTLNVHSYAVLPIRGRHAILGAISLMRSTPDKPYTQQDLVLLSALAEQIGLALENSGSLKN